MENGVINQYSQRWTHFIDPQSQANKWIKNMVSPCMVPLPHTAGLSKCRVNSGGSAWLSAPTAPTSPLCLQEKDSGLDVFKLSDRDFLRSMENAIRFGKPCLLENVGEELDPALEPVLLKQVGLQRQGSGGRLSVWTGEGAAPSLPHW